MSNLRVEFIQNDNGQDFIEISRVGDGNSVIYKLSEKREWLEKNFPLDLAAHEGGGKIKIKHKAATALTKLDGVGPRRAKQLIAERVETIEQLSELSDASVNALGPAVMEMRNKARQYLAEQAGEKPKQVVG